jgi:hypothetical protein
MRTLVLTSLAAAALIASAVPAAAAPSGVPARGPEPSSNGLVQVVGDAVDGTDSLGQPNPVAPTLGNAIIGIPRLR